MGSSQRIIERLQSNGARITKVRRLIVDIFEGNRLPLSELDIRDKLSVYGHDVNKTTVYRALKCLGENGVIREIDFGDGRKRYELNEGHHHHIVCTNCKSVDEVHVDDDVSHIEQEIRRKKKFKITNHTLEFFGLCHDCSGE